MIARNTYRSAKVWKCVYRIDHKKVLVGFMVPSYRYRDLTPKFALDINQYLNSMISRYTYRSPKVWKCVSRIQHKKELVGVWSPLTDTQVSHRDFALDIKQFLNYGFKKFLQER